MQQRERWLGGEERLHRQMQQHRRVVAHRIDHDRAREVRSNLTNNVDRLGLQTLEEGQVDCHGQARPFSPRKPGRTQRMVSKTPSVCPSEAKSCSIANAL